jgi:hypothetical protein
MWLRVPTDDRCLVALAGEGPRLLWGVVTHREPMLSESG